MPGSGVRKIAVLGSGVGSMTAAFALTSRPGWQDEYEVTVYQMGWRLGGKGAAGRNPKYGDRIEEHGLHIWLGFYDNAFRMMRQCYEELDRPEGAPIRTWTEAFTQFSSVTLAEFVNGRWIPWNLEMPVNGKTPGDPSETLEPADYFEMMVQWLLEAIVGPNHEAALTKIFERHGAGKRPEAGAAAEYVEANTQESVGASRPPSHFIGWLIEHLHAAHKVAAGLPDDPAQHASDDHNKIVELLDLFLHRLKSIVEDLMEVDDATRRLFILADLGVAGLKGILLDQLLTRGFTAADDMEFRAWLAKYGASDITLASAPVREIYDLAFAYEDGDLSKPNIAAGTAMLIALRMSLDYKGAVMYKMMAGMGDTIFAPLYELLKRRGVRFEFFHRVRQLELSGDGKSVARLHIDRQVNLVDPAKGYEPFVDVKGLPAWPNEPLYDQILEGDRLRREGINLESNWSGWAPVESRVLEAGPDFDTIVLGISIAGLQPICGELIEASDAWRDMISNVKTVQTHAAQIWLDPTAKDLGWNEPTPPLIGTWAEPLDTVADMSELLPAENWTGDPPPQTILYFCGPKYSVEQPPETDRAYPTRQKESVRQTALTWLSSNIAALFPKSSDIPNEAGLDWSKLHAPDTSGMARFDEQYWRANIDPSERYVLSVAGSTKYRLRAGESGFENLVIVGDWVYSGLNAGSVEAGAMSGLAGSRAICGYPETISGWRNEK